MFPTRMYWTAYAIYHLIGQSGYPFKPMQTILASQAKRVQAMVTYAHRQVPYYRETMDKLDLTPADFRGGADLAKLPLLERDRLQRDPEYFMPAGRHPISYGFAAVEAPVSRGQSITIHAPCSRTPRTASERGPYSRC